MMADHFVIDGSNLATEGRTEPSLAQLREAVDAFHGEHPGTTVTVVVDASFEHRIDPSERAAFAKAEIATEVVSPPAGAVGRGDGFLLQIANRTTATVVSNDSFQEFHAEYQWLFEPGRLIGDLVAGEPPVGQLDGLPPAPLAHGLADKDPERSGVLEEKGTPGLCGPFVEPGGVPHRKFQETRHVHRGREDRLLRHTAAKLLGVAFDRLGQLDQAPVALDQFAQPRPELLKGLAQGGAGLLLRRLSPEQRRQGLPRMGMWFQDEVSQQRQCLSPRLGDGVGAARHQ